MCCKKCNNDCHSPSTGEPVAVMHGANAPLLQRMIEREMRKERQVLKGEATREIITLEEAVPGKNIDLN